MKGVTEWLRNNYTVDENPGMGKAGLFYYYQTMAKALQASGMVDVDLPDGRHANWRHDLALKLMQLQERDGSWINDNSRWWEKEPALVTCYALLSLETLWRGLKG